MFIEDRYDMARLILLEEYKIAVEVGAGRGKYSEWLLYNTPLKKMYSVDRWHDHNGDDRWFHHEESEKRCRERLLSFKGRSEIMKMSSKEAADTFEPHSVDFVYIDAGKDTRSITDDLLYWYDKVKHKGILAGKDYCLLPWEGCSIMSAVDRMCELTHEELRITQTDSLDPMVRHYIAHKNSPIGSSTDNSRAISMVETPTWWIMKKGHGI